MIDFSGVDPRIGKHVCIALHVCLLVNNALLVDW
jgi:hypothetical protein